LGSSKKRATARKWSLGSLGFKGYNVNIKLSFNFISSYKTSCYLFIFQFYCWNIFWGVELHFTNGETKKKEKY